MKKYSICKPDPTLKNNLLAFGFECNRGWLPLIYELLDKLQVIEDRDRVAVGHSATAASRSDVRTEVQIDTERW